MWIRELEPCLLTKSKVENESNQGQEDINYGANQMEVMGPRRTGWAIKLVLRFLMHAEVIKHASTGCHFKNSKN